MKTLIVEDEVHSANHLSALIATHCPMLEVCGIAGDSRTAKTLVDSIRPELILLDIELDRSSGFDLLVACKDQDFAVIFTTAHEQYSIRAFKFAAIDYLLKPIDLTELLVAIGKANTQRQLKGYAQQIRCLLDQFSHKNEATRTIAIPQSRELRFLQVSDITQLIAANNYTHLILKDGEKITASKGIFYFEDLLKPAGFIRPHQSYLVNPAYIRSIRPKGVVYELQLSDLSIVPVSKRNGPALKDWLLKTNIQSSQS